MVARGDLGVEIHLAEVPIIQKHLVALTRKAKKPAIVATQMLESMVKNPVPTRAEVSDIANAVLDGATHVMLSGETAFGGYPVNAVAAMADIVQTVETARTKRRVS
jgi:pyruvate kinase